MERCLPNRLLKKKIRQVEQRMNESGIVTEEEELKEKSKNKKYYFLIHFVKKNGVMIKHFPSYKVP